MQHPRDYFLHPFCPALTLIAELSELSEVLRGGAAVVLFLLGSPALGFLFSVFDRTLVMVLLTGLAS